MVEEYGTSIGQAPQTNNGQQCIPFQQQFKWSYIIQLMQLNKWFCVSCHYDKYNSNSRICRPFEFETKAYSKENTHTHTHTKLIRTSFGLRAALMLAASRWCWRLTQIHRNTCPDEVAMPWNHQRELWKCFHSINQVSFILPFSHNQWGASFVSIQKQNQKKKNIAQTDAKKERRKKMRMTRKRTTKQNQNIVFLLLWTKTTINDGKTILQSELNC